jgi:hypothetical protein
MSALVGQAWPPRRTGQVSRRPFRPGWRPARSQRRPGPRPTPRHTTPRVAVDQVAADRRPPCHAGQTGSGAKTMPASGRTEWTLDPPTRCRGGRNHRGSSPGRVAHGRAPGRRSDRLPGERTSSRAALPPPPSRTRQQSRRPRIIRRGNVKVQRRARSTAAAPTPATVLPSTRGVQAHTATGSATPGRGSSAWSVQTARSCTTCRRRASKSSGRAGRASPSRDLGCTARPMARRLGPPR